MSAELVHNFVAPAGPGERTLLLLHGTGGDENDLLPLGRALDPRAALLAPRGAVIENGMPRFFRRLAEGVFDQADLLARTRDLAAFVAEAVARYELDPARLIAVGYSNGANIAASLMLRHPGVIAGAVLMRAMVPFEPEPGAPPALAGAPVLLLSGRLDPIAGPAQAERLAAILGGAGADVTLHWEEAGHGLAPAEAGVAREWLVRRFPRAAVGAR